jgi:anti-anti-sigma factor
MPATKRKTVTASAEATGKRRKEAHVMKPGRDIVASWADDFKRKLLRKIDKGITELSIDFSRVEVIDSVGLGVVIAANNSLSNVGGRLSLVNVSKDIYRLFQTMRLDRHFEINCAE